MSKINLLSETIEMLKSNNKKESDILFVVGKIGNYIYDDERKVKVNWNTFKKYADIFYDNGFGGNEIKTSLKIVGKDFWLERGVYDGSEWWEYKSTPDIEVEFISDEKDVKDMIGINDEY